MRLNQAANTGAAKLAALALTHRAPTASHSQLLPASTATATTWINVNRARTRCGWVLLNRCRANRLTMTEHPKAIRTQDSSTTTNHR